jgi:hypothetical protein
MATINSVFIAHQLPYLFTFFSINKKVGTMPHFLNAFLGYLISLT